MTYLSLIWLTAYKFFLKPEPAEVGLGPMGMMSLVTDHLSYFRGGYLQMGNAWITDLRHFLNDDGSRATMPNPGSTLADYFCHIVKGVTTRQKDALATGVRCRKRPKRRKCPGEIIAFIDDQEAISWSCPVCEDNGVISGWKGTIWDWSVSA